jgi:hypothetical protein
MGIPKPAVCAELVKRRLDAGLLDLEPWAPLPPALSTPPVALEFTEVYLDERAFMEHAGSRDYLDGYGVVMHPALHYRPPRTFRLGTPAPSLAALLEPILHDVVLPVPDQCAVWRVPGPGAGAAGGVFLSLDVPAGPGGAAGAGVGVEGGGGDSHGEGDKDADAAAVAAALPAALQDQCTTCVVFAHPLRPGKVRVMCVLPARPSQEVLAALAALGPDRGEVHVTAPGGGLCTDAGVVEATRAALAGAGLGFVPVNGSECVGYALHARAAEVHVTP